MDGEAEPEILVQRAATELLKDLRKLLPRLLFHLNDSITTDTRRDLRDFLDVKGLEKSLELLDTFQESPQLLDPVLAELLEPLSCALIKSVDFLSQPRQVPSGSASLPRGICRLLNSLCKVRGPKVITRFLSNEARHIAPLLEAIEARASKSLNDTDPLSWEERYVYLLWMSHLVLTPFPLSSAGAGSTELLPFPENGWRVEEDMPFVSRLCKLGHYFLSSPSKERDAAVAFLVRLVLRPDVQEIGLPDTALTWAYEQLKLALASAPDHAVDGAFLYRILGMLSFVAGIFNSANATLVAHHLVPVFQLTKKIGETGSPSSSQSGVSAVGRKFVIKICRSCVIAGINLSKAEGPYSEVIDEIIEDAIGDLLMYLGDQDAPVRLAASKALSVVITRLQPDMATEVIEAIIASLDENVVWTDNINDGLENKMKASGQRRDVSLVSPFRWQGLTLTLAHLLFRRAPAPAMLSSILNSLLMALSFEQRSTTGNSIGNTVRDAASFGIWSLARRYTTTEISSVDTSSIPMISSSYQSFSVLQVLACELACTACFDPVGNIRRGASAALQELIGRHPDTISQGINIVQAVDYHAVSLLSKSMTNVALSAARLSPEYHERLISELVGWRGIYAADVSTRRLAARSISSLASLFGENGLLDTIDVIWANMLKSQTRDVGSRHGLLLALASLLSELFLLQKPAEGARLSSAAESRMKTIWQICSDGYHINEDAFTSASLRPVLTAEAFCSLLTNILKLSSHHGRIGPSEELVSRAITYTELSLNLKEKIAFVPAADAATLLLKCGILGSNLCNTLSSKWLSRTTQIVRAGPGRQANAAGWLHVLASMYMLLNDTQKDAARQVFADALGTKAEIETRVSALESMLQIASQLVKDQRITNALQDKLQDYTTDQRGDIGSLARIAALEYVKILPSSWFSANPEEYLTFKAIIFGLAAEKLDKVRGTSYECLSTILRSGENDREEGISTGTGLVWRVRSDTSEFALRSDVSSITYFRRLLEFADFHKVNQPLLLGLSSTISGASEIASESARNALADYLIDADEARRRVMLEDLVSILQDSIGNERTVTAVLETIAYVLQSRTLSSLYASSNGGPASCFKSLFSFVQKAHLKSTILPKLLAAVELYASLARVKCVRTSVLKKLLSMLAHPFPKVRSAAAESLWCVTTNEVLLPVDWTKPVAELKGHIEAAKAAIAPSK